MKEIALTQGQVALRELVKAGLLPEEMGKI